MNISSAHKNPSRKMCEEIIRKILTREQDEQGANRHFRQASDFIAYFESLYPASQSLTKQVQRAVCALNLPRDDDGYFIINRTAEEYEAEQELARLLAKSQACNLKECAPFLLKAPAQYRSYMLHLIADSTQLGHLYETVFETNNGILFFTNTPDELHAALAPYLMDSEDAQAFPADKR